MCHTHAHSRSICFFSLLSIKGKFICHFSKTESSELHLRYKSHFYLVFLHLSDRGTVTRCLEWCYHTPNLCQSAHLKLWAVNPFLSGFASWFQSTACYILRAPHTSIKLPALTLYTYWFYFSQNDLIIVTLYVCEIEDK